MIKLNEESPPSEFAEAASPITPRGVTLDRAAEFAREIAPRLRASASVEVLVREWLAELIRFAESPGGALRMRSENGAWTTPTNRGFPGLDLGMEHAPSRHGELVFETFVTGKPKLIPPRNHRREDPEANPTDHLLLIAPLAASGTMLGVVELLLAAASTPLRQAEAHRAITLTGELFGELRNRERARLEAKLACVEELERFTQAVHRKLDVKYVAYAVANDGKRLVKADRVSVLVRRGRRYELTAVSGLETVEHRSQAAKLLAALTAQVVGAGGSLAYPGDTENLAPPIREALEDYVDETHVRTLAVVPLVVKPDENAEKLDVAQRNAPELLGALVLERFAEAEEATALAERGTFLAEHAATALTNALSYERIPLAPLWRVSDRVVAQFGPGTRRRTWMILAALAVVTTTLIFLPIDFTIHADAVLKPAEQRSAFAPWDGTVKSLMVRHGDRVVAGQPLLELRNVDLDVALVDTTGERTAAREQLSAVERSLYEDSSRLAVQERHRLSGQRSELKQKLRSLDQQLELLQRKKEQLVVTSPIAGEVTTWNLEQLLLNRPVRAGQVLVEVGDVSGAWELELKVPEDDIGHVVQAQSKLGEQLSIRYRLAAAPAEEHGATIREVHRSAEVRGEAGNTVLVRAALAAEKLPPQRPGAAASTKIYCGRASLGYVWLHDAVDYLRTKVLFRL